MIREGRNSPSTTIRNTPNETPMIRATVASSPPNPGTNLAKVPWGVERAVAPGAKHRSRFFQQEGCPSLWAQRIASVCAQVPDCLRFGKRGARQRGGVCQFRRGAAVEPVLVLHLYRSARTRSWMLVHHHSHLDQPEAATGRLGFLH